jgi:hypothetical protein
LFNHVYQVVVVEAREIADAAEHRATMEDAPYWQPAGRQRSAGYCIPEAVIGHAKDGDA